MALAFALAAPLSTPERPPAPIYGGAPVAPGAWNSVVVVDFGVDFCTGTLITDRVVLTAGHCFTSFTSAPPPR
ncbi:MAG: trypsin-like serine protease [Myxococcales bacterium]|nr:trypsin-like serine protease [Myxococcales bacterium]